MADDFWGGFLRGFSGPFSEGLINRTRSKQAQLEAEMQDLQKRLQEQTDPRYRDAYMAAIMELSQKGKPGTGYKALAKRISVMGGDTMAGSPASGAMPQALTTPAAPGPPMVQTLPAPPPAMAGQPGTPMPPPGPPAGGPPAMPTGGPVPPPAAAPAPPPMAAALPATSPTAATGSSAPPQQQPEQPKPEGGPPGEDELLAYGKQMGQMAPEVPPMPQRPEGPQTRAMQEQYKVEAENWRDAQKSYTDYMNRLAAQMYQERKAIATQKAREQERVADREFRRTERLQGQEFKAAEADETRANRLAVAGMRANTEDRAIAREERAAKRKAEADFNSEMTKIDTRAANPDRMRALKPEAAEALREAARERYRVATGGEEPPNVKGAQLPARGAKPAPAPGGAKGPPAEPAKSVPPAARAKVQELIRTQGKAGACKAIASSPAIPQPVKDAMKVEFRCP